MKVFVGSQPIFDRKSNVIAYELLYRNSQDKNYYDAENGDYATTDVIINGFLGIGIKKLSNHKKCFINFTENLLLQEIPTYFSSEVIVIEILENILPNKKLLNVLKKLKRSGYMIALDDFVLKEEYISFLPYADIIKIDFLQTTKEQTKKIMDLCKNTKIKFLAEKVETPEAYQLAKKLGFHYFQGYFFSKPKIIKGNDLKPNSQQYILIYNEINQPEPDINKISSIIEKDLALTYRLLRIINSPAYDLQSEIHSIKQAIVLLGLTEVKKWVTVMMLSTPNHSYCKEAFHLSLTRAKICESFGNIKRDSSSELFLLGLLSLIDTLLHRPMKTILRELPLTENIKEGLLNETSVYGKMLYLIKSLEKAEISKILSLCEELSFDSEQVFKLYFDAQEWSNRTITDLHLYQRKECIK